MNSLNFDYMESLIVAFIQQIPGTLCAVDESWIENVVLRIPSGVSRCCNSQHIFGRHFPVCAVVLFLWTLLKPERFDYNESHTKD